MKSYSRTILLLLAATAAFSFHGCASQEARTERVERRQDRMDERAEGRAVRRAIRSEREDARARQRLESW